MGKALDGAENERSLSGIALLDQRVELLLADLGGLAFQRIVAIAFEVAAQRIEMLDEGAAARLVTDEAVIVAHFEIVAGDDDRGQLGGAMRPGRGIAWLLGSRRGHG